MSANTDVATCGLGNHTQTFIINAKSDSFLSYVNFLMGTCIFIIACALFAPAWRTPPMMIVGTVGPIIALVFLNRHKHSLRHRDIAVKLYREGFSCSRENGSEILYRWADVSHVWQYGVVSYQNSTLTGTTSHIILEFRDGATVKLDLSSRRRAYREYVERLSTTIQNECTQRILKIAISSFNGGQIVPFGRSINLNKQRVVVRDKMLTWDQIQKVGIINGEVFIRQQGKVINPSVMVNISGVPDLYVLLKLVALVQSSTYNGREVGLLPLS